MNRIEPIVTEKTLDQAREHNIYTFGVIEKKSKVTKPHIRSWIEDKYEVKVLNVNSNVRIGKEKRFGASKRTYFTPFKKFFFVKLSEGDTISEFNISESDK